MIKLYAHRANLNGPGTGENRPEAIEECLKRGFGVEVDIFGFNGGLWMGHSHPEWKTTPGFLERNGVICHAKNIEAAALLLSRTSVNFFCLEQDAFALCSNGLIWANYGSVPNSLSIMCSPELVEAPENIETFYERVKGCHGICTDYPHKYQVLGNF